MAKQGTTKSRYEGKYVATKSFNHKTVIASGKDPSKVRASAKKRGFNSPVVFFVPVEGALNIF